MEEVRCTEYVGVSVDVGSREHRQGRQTGGGEGQGRMEARSVYPGTQAKQGTQRQRRPPETGDLETAREDQEGEQSRLGMD